MTGSSPTETPITRSWVDTLAGVGLGVGVCALAVYLWCIGLPVASVIVGVVGLVLGVAGWFVAGVTACPTCGQRLTSVPLMAGTSYERCPSCGSYAEGEGGKLRPIEPEHVADEPVFSIALPDEFMIPEMCCVCGEPPTRQEELSIELREVRSRPSLKPLRAVNVTVQVPYCDGDSAGAKLTREPAEWRSSSKTGRFSRPASPVTVLKVRSYAFYREFLRLNGVGWEGVRKPNAAAEAMRKI